MRSLKHNMTLDEYVDFPFKSAQFGSINNRQVSLLAGEEHAHEAEVPGARGGDERGGLAHAEPTPGGGQARGKAAGGLISTEEYDMHRR